MPGWRVGACRFPVESAEPDQREKISGERLRTSQAATAKVFFLLER